MLLNCDYNLLGTIPAKQRSIYSLLTSICWLRQQKFQLINENIEFLIVKKY